MLCLVDLGLRVFGGFFEAHQIGREVWDISTLFLAEEMILSGNSLTTYG